MLPAWSLVFGVAFGAAIGSFLNVLIYRLPRRLSIIFPPSHCPACQHRLGVRDLVPLLSYLWQRGRCRYCRAPIAARYFLVELWSASVWGWLWWQHLVLDELPLRFLCYALACALLIAVFFIDLEHTIIPDELSLALLGMGLLHAGLVVQPTEWSWARPGEVNLKNAFWSAEIGTGILCAIAVLGRVVFRRDAMGHGDIKLVRAMGALLLLPALLTACALAVAGGAIIGGIWLLWQSRRQMAKGAAQAVSGEGEGEPPPPEPIGSLLLMCLVYLLWLDVPLSLLPARWQEQVYARLGQPADESE
ncbi:MAG: prepilin peptidase, partial [Fimbriimonadales bacterium]|nr:prepilin peptidase [Fimbriimonadales bacterium]